MNKIKRGFGSALCAFMYVQLDLLPENLDWSIVSPKELGTEDMSQITFFKIVL